MQCTDALPAFIISSEQVIIQEDPDISRPRIRSLSDLPLLFIFSEDTYSRSVGVWQGWGYVLCGKRKEGLIMQHKKFPCYYDSILLKSGVINMVVGPASLEGRVGE